MKKGGAVAIKISSSSLEIRSKPKTAPFERVANDEVRFPVVGALEAVGTVTFRGTRGDHAAGWTVGFLQAQVSETNYAIYRGVDEASGTVFEDRASIGSGVIPCFDAWAGNTPFIETEATQHHKPAGASTSLPFVAACPAVLQQEDCAVSVVYYDAPSAVYLTLRDNALTKTPNFLNEVHVAFGFVTVLAARDPAGKFHYLQGFTWETAWQQKVMITGRSIAGVPVGRGNRFSLGPMFEGAPRDRAAIRIFEGERKITCNMIGDRAQQHPKLRAVNGWPVYASPR